MKKLNLFVLSLLSIMLLTSCDQLEDIFGNNDNSHENWMFAYAENYVDSLNAIFSNEGYVALFGGTEMNLNSNTEELERTIYVAKADFESGMVDEDNATLIVVDSTYMPIQISSKKCIIRFSPFENGNFSCLVNYGEDDDWTEYDGFNIGVLKTTSELHTRSLATGGVSDFTIANVLKALDSINGIKGCFQATSMKECVSEGVGVFSNFSPNDEVGITGGLISAGLTKSLSSGLLSILSYAGDKISDGPLKYLGPVRLSIENVEQLDAQSCKIGYMVDGLHEYGMANSDLYFELRNVKTGKYYPRLYLEPKNGYENAVIANLEPGEYGIILHIRTKKYNWEYTTYPEVKFSIFNLELDKYEIEENPQYEDGAVNFKMNIFLKGNEDGLKDIQQFGYYTKYANAIPDYKEVKNISSIFESTPLTYELLIPRDGFSDETINYTTFQAKPSIDYYIGVYVVLKNGEITHFDEQTIENLIYEEKPEVTTLDAVTVSQNEATLKCEFDNCLFWGGERGIEYTDGSSNDYLLLDVTKEDGICEFYLTDLKPNTNYKYRAYYEINEKKMYGELRTFTTEESEGCTDGNHVHAVDLGLSVKWACCNVGASSPEGYGSYFAWGETSSKSDYGWDTYKYSHDQFWALTKYCNDSDYGYNGYTDNKTTLDLIDDAARSNWGGSWRMPTTIELQELINRNNCTWTWTTLNGIKGYKVTSKSNGNSIFLPAAGYRDGTDVYYDGSYDLYYGSYWSSSLISDNPYEAYRLYFYSDDV